MSHEIHVGSSLPPGWDAFSLGSKASFVTSGSRGWARFYSESGDLFLRSQNIRSGHLDLEDRQHVLPPAGAEGERTRVQPNDLLVTITGNSVGNVAISSDELGISYISQHVGMIRLVNPSLAPYACWYLSPGAPGNKQIMDAQTGQSKPGLNLQNLKDLVVAAPKDKRERDFIVAALDDIQAQADEMQMLLSKKRMLKQAAMQELLTGKRRLPGFEGEWVVKRLGDVAVLNRINIVPSAHPDELFAHFSLPAFDAGKVVQAEPGSSIGSNKFCVPPSAILVSKLNPRIPRVWAPGIVPANAVASTEWLVLTPREDIDRNYLCVLCSSPSFSGQMELAATGTTGSHQRISPGTALDIRILFAPLRDEQAAISSIIFDMEAELSTLEQRLCKARKLKQGMMQQLLTGKIRLP